MKLLTVLALCLALQSCTLTPVMLVYNRGTILYSPDLGVFKEYDQRQLNDEQSVEKPAVENKFEEILRQSRSKK
jgi:(2Fe-2S) ferredoxin